jgi:integrase
MRGAPTKENDVTDQPKKAGRLERTKTPGIYKRGDRYVVVWRYRGRQFKSSHRTLAEAREAKGKRQRDAAPPSRVRFDDYAERWVDEYRGRTKRGMISDSTRVGYRRAVADHLAPHFRGTRIDAITASDVRAMFGALEQKGVSPAGVRAITRVLSALMATAAEDGLIAANPVRGVRYVPARRPTLDEEQAARERLRPLTRAEAAALLDAIPGDRDRLVVRLLLSTGLRIGELVGLRWANVELGPTPRIRVIEQLHRGTRAALKTPSARREVPLSPALADALRVMRRDGYAGEDAPVFPTKVGTPLNPSAIAGRVIKPAARSIGLPWVHAHTLRRTAGAWLLQAGRTPVQVQRWLGHADPASRCARPTWAWSTRASATPRCSTPPWTRPPRATRRQPASRRQSQARRARRHRILRPCTPFARQVQGAAGADHAYESAALTN